MTEFENLPEVTGLTVLGLDLSTTCTGWSIYSLDTKQLYVGCIKITDKIKRENEITDFNGLMDHITETLSIIIDKSSPVLVVIEDTFTNIRNAKTSKTLISLGAIVRYSLHQSHYLYQDVPPCTLKKFIAGKGNATKEEVIEAVQIKTGFDCKKNDNIADAIALSLFGANELFGKSNKEKSND